MFSIFKKKKAPQHSFASLKVDMHSHLIPGIDDGAKTMEDTLELLQGLQRLGYQKVITTPHIYYELYPNSSAIILEGLAKVQQAAKAANLEIEVDAAAEYFMDEHFESLLEQEDLLTIGDTQMVLVEMSFLGEAPKLHDYLFRLQTKGYTPLLAHPERYTFYKNDLSKYEDLKNRGCLFQLNLLSLQGHYGKGVQQLAQKMLKAEMIDFLGTDLHNEHHLESLFELGSLHSTEKVLKNYTFKNHKLT